MSDKIRVGIIGTGWGVNVHGACLNNCDQAEVVAICGQSEEKTKKIADELGGIGWYTNYLSMLDRPELDAIVVATPDYTHHQIVMDAVDRKLHVLCEKPLAENAAKALEMWDRAAAEGVKHMAFFSWHWFPHLHYIKQLLGEGYVGRPFQVHVTWFQPFKLRPEQYAWRFDAERTVGTIGDLGAHVFYVVRFLIGPIVTVQASLRDFTTKPDRDGRPTQSSNDSALVLLGFANGAHGSVAVTQASLDAGLLAQIELVGEDGTLRLDLSWQEGMVLRGQRVGESEPTVLELPREMAGPYGGATDLWEMIITSLTNGTDGAGSFVTAIVNDEQAVPDFEEGYLAQKVIDAAIVSDQEGRRVELE